MNKLSRNLAVLAVSATAAASSFAVGPTAGDLTNMVPDMATVLTAIGAVALALLGVQLAIKGFRIVAGLVGKR